MDSFVSGLVRGIWRGAYSYFAPLHVLWRAILFVSKAMNEAYDEATRKADAAYDRWRARRQ